MGLVHIVENGEIVETIEVEDEPAVVTDTFDEAAVLDRAELARRAAYDAVMDGGVRSMARLEEADQAGSEAFRAVLREAGSGGQ